MSNLYMYGEDLRNKFVADIESDIEYKDVFIRGENNHDYDDLTLSVNNFQEFDEAWNLFLDECSDISDGKLNVEFYDEDEDYEKKVMSLDFREGKISKIDIKIDDISIITDVLLMLEEHFREDIEVIIHIKNRSYDEFDKVAEILRKYNSKISYTVDYESYPYEFDTDVDGFEYMRGAIDYYKNIINENDLSPYEKLIYAYDLLKSFTYFECKEDLSKSREIHEIVKDGYIVCVGYSLFLYQLLSELGIDASILTLSVFDNGEEFGHERNIVYLKDEKYDIDGVYSLDATYDSRSDDLSLVLDGEGEKVKKHPNDNDTILKKYDPTALFRNFLVPYSEYSLNYATEIENVYESLPEFIYNIDNVDSLSEFDMNFFVDFIRKLFGNDCDINECINKAKNSPVISNDKLRSALETVKRCQGYTADEAKHFVDDVIEIREIQEKLINSKKKSSAVTDEKSY